jgi:adenylate cyclase
VSTTLLCCFAVAGLGRALLVGRLIDAAPPLSQPARALWLDLGAFVAAGVLLMLWNRVTIGFPFSSGGRVVVGALTIGLFAGLDAALARERAVLRAGGETPVAVAGGVFSLSRKFAVVAFALLALLTIDLLLLGIHDLRQTVVDAVTGEAGMKGVQRELMLEGLAALLVVVPLVGNLLGSFALNVRLFLDNERRVLDAVARGDLDVRVAVATRDEFAVIAARTNQMIDGLRERRQIRDLVGKLASPQVVARLLHNKDALKLGGARRDVVVLFSDVRDFTTRTEGADPEVLVADLNRYFTRMVGCVHAHGGVVDKFIGDGMMAVFGLDGEPGAADAAVAAARAMHRALDELNPQLSAPMAIGVGLHAGEVIAGNIGSPDRLEYTVIGDVVNAAARIEGLTKSVGRSPLISQAVKDALRGEAAALAWTSAGEQALKGKSERLALWALA